MICILPFLFLFFVLSQSMNHIRMKIAKSSDLASKKKTLHTAAALFSVHDSFPKFGDCGPEGMDLFYSAHIMKFTRYFQAYHGDLFISHSSTTESARNRKQYSVCIKTGLLFQFPDSCFHSFFAWFDQARREFQTVCIDRVPELFCREDFSILKNWDNTYCINAMAKGLSAEHFLFVLTADDLIWHAGAIYVVFSFIQMKKPCGRFQFL